MLFVTYLHLHINRRGPADSFSVAGGNTFFREYENFGSLLKLQLFFKIFSHIKYLVIANQMKLNTLKSEFQAR